MAEHGNWPVFSTEFEKNCIYFGGILAGKFCILKDGIRQSYNPTDTDIT